MMSIKRFFAKPLASRARKKIDKWAAKPIETQEKVFEH